MILRFAEMLFCSVDRRFASSIRWNAEQLAVEGIRVPPDQREYRHRDDGRHGVDEHDAEVGIPCSRAVNKRRFSISLGRPRKNWLKM